MTDNRPSVKKNTCVAIVAPSSYVPDDLALDRGIAALEARGCRVKNYSAQGEKCQRFAATDAQRAAQLHAAARDPDVQIVLALRGGYGMSRLMHLLDFKVLANSGKLFVGHSDFTAFQMALLKQHGTISFCGPMLSIDFTRDDPSDFTQDDFWQCLTAPEHTIVGKSDAHSAIDVSGTLWGGNLSILTHLVGTPYLPKIDGGILFVEDISEHPYRIERMLLQLLHAGILARQKAILLGDFSNYSLSEYDNGYDFAAMVSYIRSQLTVPVLTGLPFGHIRDKVTLPVGAQARLQSDGEDFQLSMRDYPVL